MIRHKPPVTVVLMLAVGIIAACAGSQGPQGAAGPPADRSKMYCRYSNSILTPPSQLTATVTCDAKTDIPWEGSCNAAHLPTGYYVASSVPLNWEDVSMLPGWSCTWAPWDNAPAMLQPFGADAVICCFAIGHDVTK